MWFAAQVIISPKVEAQKWTENNEISKTNSPEEWQMVVFDVEPSVGTLARAGLWQIIPWFTSVYKNDPEKESSACQLNCFCIKTPLWPRGVIRLCLKIATRFRYLSIPILQVLEDDAQDVTGDDAFQELRCFAAQQCHVRQLLHQLEPERILCKIINIINISSFSTGVTITILIQLLFLTCTLVASPFCHYRSLKK